MEAYYEILPQCPLFAGISRQEMPEILDCLDKRVIEVPKGAPVFLEGEPARFVGVVLSGGVQIVRDDYYGNRSVLTVVAPGGMFAEAFVCAGLDALPVSAFAVQSSTVLLLDCSRVMNDCLFHSRLVYNLLRGMARKNLALTEKIRFMSRKTTREKLMEFLLDQAKRHGSAEFTIPYDRQALADYLGVERSAMSAEIGKLRKDGLIETSGAWFRVAASDGK